jgi:hypothetical protein
MARRDPRSQTEIVASWEAMLAAAAEHGTALGDDAQPTIAKLQGYLDEAKAVFALQERATADRQEASKRIVKIIRGGARVATLLRFILKDRFGYDSERLVQFGVRPFRGVRRLLKPKEPAEPTPEPTTPSPDPTTPPSSSPPFDPAT